MNTNPLDTIERFVPLIDAPGPSLARVVARRDRRRRQRRVAAATGGAGTIVGVVATLAMVLPGTEPAPSANPATSPLGGVPVPSPPAVSSACSMNAVNPHGGVEEQIRIPLEEGGELTLQRGRGYVMGQAMRDVTDPRFDGEWTMSWNEDDYRGAGGVVANLVTNSWRIETDDGAWTGTSTMARFEDGVPVGNSVVLTGEGGYEGLQAVLYEVDPSFDEDGCKYPMRIVVVDAVPDDTAVLD